MRALIVDDNEISLEILQTVLVQLGYEVEHACNGKEALASLRKHSIHLVITDWERPQRCMGNRKLASKALKIFESGLVKDVGLLLENVTKGDAKAVAASAHKIKGSAANVSAEQVRAIAAELEKLARADELSHANDSLDELDSEIRRFQEYLSTALAGLSSQEPIDSATTRRHLFST